MLSQSIAVVPEFETAKRIAMTASINEDGNYLVGKKVVENGSEFAYVVGYVPSVGLIGGSIIKGTQVASVVYDEKNDSYFYEVGDFSTGITSSKILTEEQAVAIMRNILKRLVNTAILY